MMRSASPEVLPTFQFGEWHVSRDTMPVPGGGTVSVAPEVAIITQLRLAATAPAPLDPDQLRTILRAAARSFRDDMVSIDGWDQSFDAFADAMLGCQGIPRPVTAAWSGELVGLVDALTDRQSGRAQSWMAISLPANTFLCLESVYQALWDGHRVFVRASQREPFAALRLVAALRKSGLPSDRLMVATTTQPTLRAVLRYFDRAVLYGGGALGPLAAPGDPRIVVKGAGCAVAVVSGAGTADAALSVASLASRCCGRLCTNARVALVSSGAAPFAEAVARALTPLGGRSTGSDLPIPIDADAVKALRSNLLARLGSGDRLLLGGNSHIERGRPIEPLVIQTPSIVDHPLRFAEPPFPFLLIGEGTWPATAPSFDHALFVYAVDATGAVTTMRHDGVDRDVAQAA